MSRADEPRYEARRNPHLPWGYWLLMDGTGGEPLQLVDEDGRRWNGLREALWVGRLGMAGYGGYGWIEEGQVEFLLAVLAAVDRAVVSTASTVLDLFGGSWHRTAHYAAWLGGQKLIEPAGMLTDARLTAEGRAVLVMLASTRERDQEALPIGLPILHPFARLRRPSDPAAVQAAIGAAEAALPAMRSRFLRRQVSDEAAVALVGVADAHLPMAETLWSLAFPEAYQRDRFYLWLLHQADRWERWTAKHRQERPGALTEHLLALLVAQVVEEEEREEDG